jgi:AraC-like DNA-binding protein
MSGFLKQHQYWWRIFKIENMNNWDRLYEPHLAIKKFSILPGKEWSPRSCEWSLIQVESGAGYWLRAQSFAELEKGTALLVSGDGQGRIRASQLNSMSLYSSNVMPDRLTGLITRSEQGFLKQAVSQTGLAFQVFPPRHPIALKMTEICANCNQRGLLFRLALLQLFVEIFDKQLDQAVPVPENGDARERLHTFLMETPSDTLLEMDSNKLAQIIHCTPRHFSRIFFELTGMSFYDRRAEIRLARASELLATSRSKVVEVAFESGYRSLSLFNQMFTRRFGMSPGKWRKKFRINRGNKNQRNGIQPMTCQR